MDRSGFKAIAKAVKAKGLQRLRWYCQMCEKQCRDANGFKCHCMSEAHRRQMEIFATNSKKYIEQFSSQFENQFLGLLSTRWNTNRVNANLVYNELIRDRDHVHMNSTKWPSLSVFVQYLEREGKCVVEETEKGWYVTWIDSGGPNGNGAAGDVVSTKEKKKKHDQLDEQLHQRELLSQARAAREVAISQGLDLERKQTELKRPSTGERLELGLKLNKKRKRQQRLIPNDGGSEGKREEDSKAPKHSAETGITLASIGGSDTKTLKGSPNFDSATRNTLVGEPTTPSVDFVDGCWLVKGIIVKLVSKKEKYEKWIGKKGRVESVDTVRIGYGLIRMLDDMQTVLEIKQSHVETVIPNLGGQVMVVSKHADFAHRGALGKLVDVNVEKYSATVRLFDGAELVVGLDYENVCKFS